MTAYVFDPAPQAAASVRGSAQRYAVQRIFCVGRNYAAHAREMGGDPEREPPFFFNKTPAHLVSSGVTLPYALETRDLQHEIELVVALGQPAFRVTPEQAQDCVWAYACGLDMTRRDLQGAAKKKGQPWAFGKDFEGAAVLGELVPAHQIGHPARGAIELAVNGTRRQHGDLADMVWRVAEVVARLSRYYHLGPGDLIYTGTPEGVGPVQPGDRLTGRIEGVGEIELAIGQSQ
ncbi:MAG TPA: fumarylacetoacetate hydrolase family protein [Ottowia sp.]|uniref:fumarylacetoacetate hydrolase family protein n=1 Tax=Ottowia sp. TaxID=1898956 RepID=UPI002BBA4776|nr:fumarylacetoacetate hydrolase family protein [Ottowia sp.]HMN21324.1 fumarylacetoacetate hydrolase family protein [Ottowia sp.]